jgi:hypothetical protein
VNAPRTLAVALLVGVMLAGCSDDRPSEAAWAAEWERAQALVPSADELMAGGRPLCDELVGELRETLPDLTPTPDQSLDDAVGAWTDEAETIVFDCELDPELLTERMDELDVLTAEVDAGLAAEGG